MGAPDRQSSTMSIVEAATNVVVGYFAALLTQMAVFPLLSISVNLGDNVLIGLAFTIVSLARSYALRRAFEHLRVRPLIRSRSEG